MLQKINLIFKMIGNWISFLGKFYGRESIGQHFRSIFVVIWTLRGKTLLPKFKNNCISGYNKTFVNKSLRVVY